MKIFLGGTCANTTWREELIKEIEPAGIEYFNPVVKDWTPECQTIEEDEKNKENVVFQIGRYTFDSQKQLLSIDGESVKLTTKEAELLALLGARVNELLQRDYALKTIWVDDNYFNARSMDVYITKLRKHLKKDSNVEILNVHGKGYKLVVTNNEL